MGTTVNGIYLPALGEGVGGVPNNDWGDEVNDNFLRLGDIGINAAAFGTDVTAINSAIAALPSEGGRVLVPYQSGGWNCDTSIVINKGGVELIALGPPGFQNTTGVVNLNAVTGLTGPLLDIGGAAVSENRGPIIRGFTFRRSSGTSEGAIRCRGHLNLVLDNPDIQGWSSAGNYAIKLAAGTVGTQWATIFNPRIRDCMQGFVSSWANGVNVFGGFVSLTNVNPPTVGSVGAMLYEGDSWHFWGTAFNNYETYFKTYGANPDTSTNTSSGSHGFFGVRLEKSSTQGGVGFDINGFDSANRCREIRVVAPQMTNLSTGFLLGEWALRNRLIAPNMNSVATPYNIHATAETTTSHFKLQTTKPIVSGSRGGNAALASLLTALSSYGFITDSSSA